VRENGGTVVADLSGDPLRYALEGGLDVLKVNDDELCRENRATGNDAQSLIAGMHELVKSGADQAIVTRAAEPALALIDGSVVVIEPPRLEAADHRGAGDSFTAGVAATLASGGSLLEGLRLGAAAAALNVTRHGLATGKRPEIERLAPHVGVSSLEAHQ